MAREELNPNQEIDHFKSHKKGGVKIPKTEYAVVFVQYQVKQTYCKLRTIGQREEMLCLISFGLSLLIK
jgi:hypothetical protein